MSSSYIFFETMHLFSDKILTFFPNFSKLTELPLKTYSVQFPLDNLSPGVDNIHFDVYLSPAFCHSVGKLVRQLFLKHGKVTNYLDKDNTSSLVAEKEEFKHHCRDVLHTAVNQAKSASEVQIDLLAQVAIIKKLTKEISFQFNSLSEDLNDIARKHEISSSEGLSGYIKIKEKLSQIQENKKSIILRIASDLFRYLLEVHQESIAEMRESILGPETALPEDIFSNPIIHAENPFEGLFMMEKYVLIGHRFEDPDSYENLLLLIRKLLRKILLRIFLKGLSAAKEPVDKANTVRRSHGFFLKSTKDSRYDEIDIWLKQVENVDMLFNSFKSWEHYNYLKNQDAGQKELSKLKNLMKNQDKLLHFLYKNFKETGLIQRITAFYEMKSIYLEYCPPLAPHQVLQYLIQPKRRKDIARQISRVKGFYGKTFSLAPLKNKITAIRKVRVRAKKKYLIQFLNDFARYHRDLQNFLMLREAMDRVNLVSEQKIIELSRENHILYEFLLPDEQMPEDKPIINHVVVKADVRDSTRITLKMKEKGLNPASFFSLNFFAPITGILYDYSAEKVFLEGDAIILSISEHEDTPQEWYSVARACGLAKNILQIVQKYNSQSEKHQLPVLELGIGISYTNSSPTFLFDENHRIMISPAINAADRMSRCTKPLCREIHNPEYPFNLYIFQKASENDAASSPDGLLLRYNVNGIELNAEGFAKLSQEIDLQSFACHIPKLQAEKINVHTGKFPTVTGKYQRLIIREAQIPVVSPHDFTVIRETDRKYYEVCTNPLLDEYVEKL